MSGTPPPSPAGRRDPLVYAAPLLLLAALLVLAAMAWLGRDQGAPDAPPGTAAQSGDPASSDLPADPSQHAAPQPDDHAEPPQR